MQQLVKLHALPFYCRGDAQCLNRFPLPPATFEQAHEFTWDGHRLETGIALALSGGGFRAMLFHAGALTRLNELGILSRVVRISSVSGGSIASGYLARIWRQLETPNAAGAFEEFQQKYVGPILKFSREKVDIGDILTGLLPWTSAAEQVAASYDNASAQAGAPDQSRHGFVAQARMAAGAMKVRFPRGRRRALPARICM